MPDDHSRTNARLYLTQPAQRRLERLIRRSLLRRALAEIARAAKGEEIFFHQFDFAGLQFGLASRRNSLRDRLEVEIDLCPARLPKVTIAERERKTAPRWGR